jgi:egghead protein (zeste-white 4 protein)
MASIILGAFALRLASPQSTPPTTLLDQVWSWSSLLWLGALLPGTAGLIGALTYRQPTTLDRAQPINRTICWRIVTAGKNIDIVLNTIRRCRSEMASLPLAQYIIEVVIDYGDNIRCMPTSSNDLRIIVVPTDYQTPNNSRFKARALHYALLHSPLADAAWIVHLDEETQPTSSSIKGICNFIRQEELSQALRVGQGAILYHREWEKHPFLTLADNVRTGDDFARFHFQHRLGVTLFGLHGSFIVIRNDVEKATGGFDFGPQGDITEDAYWAVKGMQAGLRCAWVEGYLEEQSCMSLVDFLRQRRRWFHGLVKVSLHAPAKLRWRVCLGLNTMLWALAPFATIYTIGNLFYHVRIDPVITLLASYSLGVFATLYITGLKANMDEHSITDWRTRTMFTVLQILLLPVYSAMESLGVLWAMLTPVKGFQVVKK